MGRDDQGPAIERKPPTIRTGFQAERAVLAAEAGLLHAAERGQGFVRAAVDHGPAGFQAHRDALGVGLLA